VERQAQDRIHRLGQHKPVTVVRFIVAGSVEERVLALQEKKQAIFDATVGADASRLAGLTAEDMRFLFSG
jgi:DNA repair protein RAD16